MNSFWTNKKVLVTGNTGFKGSWLSMSLEMLGAQVYGFSKNGTHNDSILSKIRGSDLNRNTTYGDIRNFAEVADWVSYYKPDIVFHLAAQPLVNSGYSNPKLTYETNFNGTLSVLEATNRVSTVGAAVIITSDKVYAPTDENRPLTESDPLGGLDPYSASKSACEILVNSYYHSFFKQKGIPIATARAGNVIGGGDLTQGRIVPDYFAAKAAKKNLQLRNPKAVRPWQHVMEPVSGYIQLAEKMWKDINFAGPWNFGPNEELVYSVQDLISGLDAEDSVASQTIKPDGLVYAELDYLAISSAKAAENLEWRSQWNFKKLCKIVSDWEKQLKAGEDAKLISANLVKSILEI